MLVLSPGAVREEIARANALFGAGAAVAVAAEEISEEISGVAAGKSSNSGSSSLSEEEKQTPTNKSEIHKKRLQKKKK